MSKKKEKGQKKSPTPKKDPTQLLHEKIEEKLAMTRQCLSCINKKIKLQTLQDKMGSAMIREDQNPDEPAFVSFEYPSASLLEQLSFLANSLVSGGKGILALDEFVDEVTELLGCIQLTTIDLEEDDRPAETRAANGPMIRSCVDPWKTEQKNTRSSSEVDEKNENDNPQPQEQEIIEKKRKYIELLLTTADLGTKISGILISNPGTLKFKTDDGLNFDELINGKGMIFGTFLDLDTHLSSLGECTLLGLDNLGKRIVRKRAEGYQFLQIRCCFEINEKCPTPQAVYENCRVMGRFSCICQANKVVPILGLNFFACNNESLQFVREKTEKILVTLCKSLLDNSVFLEGILLQLQMVNPGPNYPCPLTLRQIAMATITTLNRSIPTAIPGIIFTPGKYEESDFLLILNEANKRKGKGPWSLNFFYGNYYEDGVLRVWEGSEAKIKEGQAMFLSKIQEYSRASMGLYQMMGGLPVECKKYFF